MALKLPFDVPAAVQATIAVLGVVGAAGTEILHDVSGFLSPGWATGISSVLAVIAGIAGFLQKTEPLINDLT